MTKNISLINKRVAAPADYMRHNNVNTEAASTLYLFRDT